MLYAFLGIIIVGVYVPDILNIRRCWIESFCCILLCKLCKSSGFETQALEGIVSLGQAFRCRRHERSVPLRRGEGDLSKGLTSDLLKDIVCNCGACNTFSKNPFL